MIPRVLIGCEWGTLLQLGAPRQIVPVPFNRFEQDMGPPFIFGNLTFIQLCRQSQEAIVQDPPGCPRPKFLGLLTGLTGNIGPPLSLPRPCPGFQPIPRSIWLPTFVSGIGTSNISQLYAKYIHIITLKVKMFL